MRLFSTSSSFTRPANTTTYSGNELVANDTTAGNVVPLLFTLPIQGFLLTQVKLNLNGASSNTNAQFYLHLYQFSPTVVNGDGGAFQSSESGYLGNIFIDCTVLPVFSSNMVDGISPVDPNLYPLFTDTTAGVNPNQVYGLLQISTGSGAYVPSSGEIITVTLVGVD
jgi:hypothetical protein